jgi:hypothetical protein
MTLSSVETKAEQDCIYDHIKSTFILCIELCMVMNFFAALDVMKLKDGFWLSATSKSCEKKLTWCTGSEVSTSFGSLNWIPMNPNYAAGEFCLIQSFDFGGMREGIEDVTCTVQNLYICEAA